MVDCSVRILLIDSDPEFAYLIGRYVERSGHRFTQSVGVAALSIAARLQPTVIVVGGPDVVGWAMLHTLRADDRTRATPIVLCLALADQDRALREGASACLAKPVMYDDFLVALISAGVPPLTVP